MANLHFRIGKDFGKNIVQVAHEWLIDKYDLEMGLNTITEAIPAVPHDMAKEIFLGNLVIETAEDGVNVYVVDRNDEAHSDYPIFNPIKWYQETHKWIGDTGRTYYNSFYNSYEAVWAGFDGCEVKFDMSTIIKYVLGKENGKDAIFKQLQGDAVVKCLTESIEGISRYIQRAVGLMKAQKDVLSVFEKEIEWNGDIEAVIDSGDFNVVYLLQSLLQNLEGTVSKWKANIELTDDLINNHLKSQQKIDKIYDEGLKPVDPLSHKYDALWVAPDGTCYGLNGESSNQLHQQMADMLLKSGVVSEAVGVRCDRWMCENGWARLTHNWVLYDGYSPHLERTPMTKEQQESIMKHCKNYGNVVILGINRHRMAARIFCGLGPAMLYKVFTD